MTGCDLVRGAQGQTTVGHLPWVGQHAGSGHPRGQRDDGADRADHGVFLHFWCPWPGLQRQALSNAGTASKPLMIKPEGRAIPMSRRFLLITKPQECLRAHPGLINDHGHWTARRKRAGQVQGPVPEFRPIPQGRRVAMGQRCRYAVHRTQAIADPWSRRISVLTVASAKGTTLYNWARPRSFMPPP